MMEAHDFGRDDIERLLEQAGAAWRSHILPALERGLHALPEPDEMLLHLCFYQQASDDEIAALLELPGGSAAVPAQRDAALDKLAAGSWGHTLQPLTRDHLVVLLELAGEAWRLADKPPLLASERAAAHQGVADALRHSTGWLTRHRLPGLAVAASVVLLALYGVLWLAGRAMLPDTYALADLSRYEPFLRPDTRHQDNPQDAFSEGGALLLEAPTHTLGLFPHYNQDQVARAVPSLTRAFDTAPNANQRAKAAFFLGKAYLMQNDTTQARVWLQEVLNQPSSLYHSDAQDLLERLDRLSARR
jgi:hypothetical protein